MKKIFTFIFMLSAHFLYAQSTYLTSFKTDMYGGPSKSTKAGSLLFFSAYDTIHGRELWCTDGTTTGTYMIKDINPGIANGIEDYFELTSYKLNGVVYFRGNDGVTGTELWRSDGTAAGTYLVKDLYVGNGNSSIGYFTNVNNILYFTANTGTALWRSDGTAAGTYLLKYFTIASNLFGFDGNLYFSADDNNSGQELWKSNGTTFGTQILKDLNGAFGASLPCNFHATTNALYFMAATNDGWELWKTTGSSASTVMVKDINPTGNGILDFYSDAIMVNIDSTIYFRATDGINGYQLWKSDGSDTGTVRLSSIPNGVDASCTFPIVNGNVLVNNYADAYFWQYDTALDSSYITGYPSFTYFNSYPNKFTFIGSKLYYAAKDTAFGCEIWQSDGTANGTKILQESHLTDNWFYSTLQGFNSILGVIGTQVMFTLAREPYNVNMPLFVYDASNTGTCYTPSILVPVPTSDTSMHLVWNRIENAIQYELQYKEAGSPAWTSANTSLSYFALNNLLAATDYEFRLRADCGGGWTPWSDTGFYNTAFSPADYLLHILAERSEDATTEHIYWLKTSSITKMQMRYRPVGTTNWAFATSNNGYRRITGLIPNTLYEYEYRASYDTIWDAWYPSLRYFVTSQNISTSIIEAPVEEKVDLFPNPTSGNIFISGKQMEGVEYKLTDPLGRLLKTGKWSGNQLNISELESGLYLLILQFENQQCVKRIIRE